MTIYLELKSRLSMLFLPSGPWPPPKGFNIDTELLLSLQPFKSAKEAWKTPPNIPLDTKDLRI